MDELAAIYQEASTGIEEVRRRREETERNLCAILWGSENVNNKEIEKNASVGESRSVTPAKKRPKRLTALEEDEDENRPKSSLVTKSKNVLTVDDTENNVSSTHKSPRKTRISATIVEATSTTSHEEDIVNALETAVAAVSETRSADQLMPPPAVPISVTTSDQSFARPQRAAKLNCEKHLKEPKLKTKLRRPSNEIHVKLEHEQRASQMHETDPNTKISNKTKSNVSIASATSQESVIVLPNKTPSIVTINQSDQSIASSQLENSQSTEIPKTTVQVTRELRVRIKREKLSDVNGVDNDTTNPHHKTQKETTAIVETSTSIVSTTNDTIQTKKGLRNKKAVPKPIKVERFSDVNTNEPDIPISSRTRSAEISGFEHNKNKSNKQIEQTATTSAEQNASPNEEAIETQQQLNTKTNSIETNMKQTARINETINIAQNQNSGTPNNATVVLGAAPNDATFCTAETATFVVEPQNSRANGDVASAAACTDLTFDVASASKDDTESQRSSDQSMATARDTLQPRADSLITEDESDQETTVAKPVPVSKPLPLKLNTLPFAASKKTALPAKSYKMPVREIFNPLVQSPVKKKVEAFESVAAAASKNMRNGRSKLAKENSAPVSSTSTTPLIGKPIVAASNRYLTPTQSQNNLITPNAQALAKKLPASASKTTGLTKSTSAGNLRLISSAKAPSRENSAEDFRRGTHQLAEERKKQRDQRHIQAAQQREAKERERAERLAKAAKEREEKRLKKQQLAEQKQRELQEIQRKLKLQEEAIAATAAAEVAAQKEKLMKISQQNGLSASAKARMLPPQPKSKYTFEMLHEDDSTDDEGKVTYKRPPPPTWSLSHVRGAAILAQQHMPKEPIDCFFSVQPRTLDLKTIFPKIDPRFLKRNSSVIWQTPPRYSELPKY